MTGEIISKLSELTDEEKYILSENQTDHRDFYTRSGRFLIERRRISDLTVGDSTAAVSIRKHPRFCDFPTHSHDYIEIMYVCRGSVTHVIDKKEIPLEQDDLIILGKNTRHSIKPSGENDIGINIIISPDIFENLYSSIKKSSPLSERNIEKIIEGAELDFYVFSAKNSIEIKNLIESMVSSVLCNNVVNEYILRRSVGLLIAYLCELGTDKDTAKEYGYKESVKKELLRYLNGSYSSATLTEAAKMLGLSPSYLSRLVKSIFGLTFKELLMDLRFDAACELLTYSDMPIGNIINHVGYENSSYFHKEFKKRFGVTPNLYRRSRS